MFSTVLLKLIKALKIKMWDEFRNPCEPRTYEILPHHSPPPLLDPACEWIFAEILPVKLSNNDIKRK